MKSGQSGGAGARARGSQRSIKLPELPPGPLRDLKQHLFRLYVEAGRPTMKAIATWIAEDETLSGAPSADAVYRCLTDATLPPSVDDLEAITRTLGRLARSDQATTRARQLWELVQLPDRGEEPALGLVSSTATQADVAPVRISGTDEAADEELAAIYAERVLAADHGTQYGVEGYTRNQAEKYLPLVLLVEEASSLSPKNIFDLQALLRDWASSDKSPHLILTGDAGAGKTTSLLYMRHQLAISTQALDESWICLVVPLNQYAGSLKELLTAAITSLCGDVGSQAIERIFRHPRTIIAFDGLNELGSFRERGVREIGAFIMAHPMARVIVSCRTSEYNSSLGSRNVWRLCPLARSSVEELLVRHLGVNGIKLFNDLVRDSRLLEMATNPLLLSMLAQVSSTGYLPSNRGQLFRRFVNLSFDREAAKGHEPVVSSRTVGEALAHIALTMQERRTLRLSRTDFATLARTFLKSIGEQPSVAALRDFAISAGLLRQAGGSILFSHQSYQEYFSAVALNSRPSQAALLPEDLSIDVAWVEPLLLLAGISSRADELVTNLAEKDVILAVKSVTNGAAINDATLTSLIGHLRTLSESDIWIDRRNAADLAGELRTEQGQSILGPLLHDENSEVRWGAVHAIAAIGAKSSVSDQLVASLTDPFWVVRGEACLALAAVGASETTPTIVKVLGSSEMYERGCAAEALIRMLGGAESTAARQHLESLFESSSPEVQELLHLVLDIGSSEDPVKDARKALKSSSDAVVQVAIRLAKSSRDLESVPEIVSLLSHASAEVRTASVSALGKLQARGAVDLVASSVTRDPSSTVRATAATALGEMGALEAVGPLASALLGDTDTEVRFSAARSLGRLQAGEALDSLWIALQTDSDPRVRVHAARSIGFLGVEAVQAALVAQETAEIDEDVRASIREAIANIVTGHRYVRY